MDFFIPRFFAPAIITAPRILYVLAGCSSAHFFLIWDGVRMRSTRPSALIFCDCTPRSTSFVARLLHGCKEGRDRITRVWRAFNLSHSVRRMSRISRYECVARTVLFDVACRLVLSCFELSLTTFLVLELPRLLSQLKLSCSDRLQEEIETLDPPSQVEYSVACIILKRATT